MSGLCLNPSKSDVFFGGVQATIKEQMLNILHFKEGHLSVRYLGVPLISGKLKYQDCVPLIDKMTAIISSWASKVLSFSSRLQLIKSILFSIQAFWSNVFIIPKKVKNAIDQKLACFLWSGSDGTVKVVKVAWDTICCPKKEGGLGLRRVEEWNKAAVMKFICSYSLKRTPCQWLG